MSGNKNKRKFLAQARERYRIASEGCKHIYDASLKDMKFVYDIDDAQWPSEMDNKVKLKANNLLKSLHQIQADVLQNLPRLKVVPVDDQADVDKAELMNALMRQIDHLSDADIARSTAFTHSISGSIGYYRLATEFSDPLSFDQEIKVKRIKNPHSVKFDPKANRFNKEDAVYCFIDEWMTREDFKFKYPKTEAVDFDSGNIGPEHGLWFEKDRVKIAEYFYKVKTKIKLVRVKRTFEDGSIKFQDMELTEEVQGFIDKTNSEIVGERDSFTTKLMWAKISGVDVLSETEWATDDIPIIPVQGDEVTIGGKTHLMSFHRGAHDLQKMLNFWLTKATKVMSKTPDVPVFLTSDQIEGHEGMWNQPNALDRAYLLYNATPAGKPSREQPIPAPIGMLSMIQTMNSGIEGHLGRSDPSNGAPSSERSGRAKEILINQSNKGIFVFVDNFSRAILYEGKLRVKLIPKIYDTTRALQVRGEDGEPKVVNINTPTGEIDENGRPVILNDMSVGKFDLVPALASSSATRRQEQREGLKGILQYAGQFAPAIIPEILELEDLPNAKKTADRVEKMIESLQQQK